jgi:lipoprotein-anchoring transpeptidase ErfK/SrfK
MLSRLLVAAASLALLSFGPAKADPTAPSSAEQVQAVASQAPVSPTIIAKAEDAAPAGDTAAPAAEASPADKPAADAPAAEPAAAKEPAVENSPSAEAEKPAAPPQPTMTATIDLTSQSITIVENGVEQYSWPISSGTRSHATPRGTFRPQWTAKMWYSRKYDNAPMPHAVFIHGGVAIHATYATGMLGRPASHGCIRLHPKNAKTFYNLVQRHGLKNVRVTIHGTPNWGAEPQVASRKSKQRYAAVQQQSPGWDWFGMSAPAQKPVIVGKKRKGGQVYYYASNGNVYAAQAGSRKAKKVYYNGNGYGY